MKYKIKHTVDNEVRIIGEEVDINYLKDNGWIIIEFIPENVEEDDRLDGHTYPGHECWNDY